MKFIRFFALLAFVVFAGLVLARPASAVDFEKGGDRMVEQQTTEGGWGWNEYEGPFANIHGPTGLGLLRAFQRTGKSTQKDALSTASGFLQTFAEGDFSAGNQGTLAVGLDNLADISGNVDHMNTGFYEKLSQGNYLDYTSTEDYVDRGRVSRRNRNDNLAAWDMGEGLHSASTIGAGDRGAWVEGTKAELNLMDKDGDYVAIGLAGAIHGLASAGETFDPTNGDFASNDSIKELARELADNYQLPNGGFAHYDNSETADLQVTAYSILALDAVDREAFGADIQSAYEYLTSAQTDSGGFLAGEADDDAQWGGENQEVNG